MFIDSHCHPYMLDLTPYENNLDRFMEETARAGIDALLSVGVDTQTSQQSIALTEKYPFVYASVGSHPSEHEGDDISFDTLCALAKHPKVVAIGETGLDYYYNKGNHDHMQSRFRLQIQAGIAVRKPLIIHTRDAQEDTIRIMKEERADKIGGVMHCFTESLEMAKAAIALGFYISFSGIITFKNAQPLVKVAKNIPLEKILIETDAPYLAPVPFRGKKNEPKYVKYVAEKIAEIKNISVEAVAEATSENFRRLFS
ncbi:MAG: deoxyribonuclease [Gammaproteobacteria bacterium RIFCSPHIGHO2_12_FULL_42_13]|nr:MAG: deoxyribonuclease [Gammaproteobacteria bacterium RIFCSPHIGHO2_12_FULL_42_13]